MRAIIINAEARAVSEAEIDGSLKSLQGVVGGLITPVYDGLDSKHHAYVNDEGLLNNPQHFFMLKDGHQPLAGNGVILSDDGEGGEAPCTLPLDWVKERVTFMDQRAVLQWIGKGADQWLAREPEAKDSPEYSRWTGEPAGQSPKPGDGQKP
jgi:uncharacterized protein DUF3846